MTIITRGDIDVVDDSSEISRLHELLAGQRAAFLADTYPTLAERTERVQAVAGMVLAHRRDMKDALHADFGWHPEPVADLIEILGVAGRAQYVLAELPGWMADEQRAVDPALWGSASASVRYQPKGVIGNMVPWNFPFDLSFGPLVDMLAAGNRVILKPSDLSPACSELMTSMVTKTFDDDLVAVVTGGLDLALEFPRLAWNHLMFTGSPDVGKIVMRSAAEHLVPVTLELGGKSPAIVAADAVDSTTVANLVGMKLLKSGQVCVAPDHVFVPRSRLREFVDLITAHVQTDLPGHTASDDNTGIIAERHLDRILGMVAQAREAGYEVIQPEADAVTDRLTRRTPLSVVVDPGPELDLMRQEIFGPILPVVPYDELDAVIARINAGESPLGLYVYSHDDAVVEQVLTTTTSGGACVNMSLLHGAVAQLPFGGVGNSGMGRHHSVEAFREFSNPRGVLVRGTEPDLVDAFNPPYRTLEAVVAGGYAQADGALTVAVPARAAVTEAASRLATASALGAPCASLRDLISSTDVETAYLVQERLVAGRVAAGARRIGRKIGLTSAAVQAQLGVAEPDFGTLLDDMAVQPGHPVPAGLLLQPRIEAEVAFTLGADLASDSDLAAVRAAVIYAHPALEIVDSRISGWDITLADTVADNASSGLFVLGPAVPVAELDTVAVQMTLRRDGSVVSTGSGAACLGDPLVALQWLARCSAGLGRPLRAGEVVLSGALGPMVPVAPGETYVAQISGLGEVSAMFAADEERGRP